jgi:hypothetical protein
VSDSTYSNLPPLSAEEVLADMCAAKAKLDALGPVPVEVATNPSEWWVKKSDGSHEVHRGGLVKR